MNDKQSWIRQKANGIYLYKQIRKILRSEKIRLFYRAIHAYVEGFYLINAMRRLKIDSKLF